MVFLLAGLEESAEQVWVLGDGAWSSQGEPAQPSVAPESHLSPGEGPASAWLATVHVGTRGCASSSREQPNREQPLPFLHNSIPTAQERQSKAGAASGDTTAFFNKASRRQCPTCGKQPQLCSSWQCLQVIPDVLLEREPLAGTLQRHSPKMSFSGTRCGKPDKIEELSWQGMVFSHTLPEGLNFLSQPALLA